MTLGWSSSNTTWTVFPAAAIPEKKSPNMPALKHVKDKGAPKPTFPEMEYAISLCNAQDRNQFTKPIESDSTTAAVISPCQKFSLIKDVQVDKFCDLIGQVVKIYSDGGRVELSLTDYTSNGLLYNHEWGNEVEDKPYDPYADSSRRVRNARKWNGPFGKMTLTVTLWEPHGFHLQQEAKDGDFVHLRNVRIKWSSDSKIEGCLHTDRRYPERIDVTVLTDHNDDRVKDVLRRKRDYTKRFESESKDFVKEVRGEKRKADEEGQVLTKAQKKRRRVQQKKQEEREQKAKNAEGETKNPSSTKPDLNKYGETHLVHLSLTILTLPLQVRCNNPTKPTRPLSSILADHETTTPKGATYILPFQNVRSRATVRVVDFFPPKLEDFSRKSVSSEYDVLSDSESEVDSNSDDDDGSGAGSDRGAASVKWEWAFYLLVEDANPVPRGQTKTRMKVVVAGNDAEFLLRLDAEE